MKVINRINIWQKLSLLMLISLVICAIPTAMLFFMAQKEIAVTQREVLGAELADKVVFTIGSMQKHRGLSNTVLNGNASLDPARIKERDAVDQGLAEMSKLMSNSPKLQKLLGETRQGWKAVHSAVDNRSIAFGDSFQRHTELVEKLLALLDGVLDETGLAFDADRGSHFITQSNFVHTLWLTEYLGQARALGAGALARKSLSQEQNIQLTSTIEAASKSLQSVASNLAKVWEEHPALARKMEPIVQKARNEAQNAIALARKEVLFGELTFDSARYFALFTEAVDVQFELIDQLRKEQIGLFEADLARQRKSQLSMIAVGVALLAIAVVLSIAIAWSISRPLKQATDVAQSIARGNVNNKIEPGNGTDEVASLLRSLQTMQADLADMLGEINRVSLSISDGADRLTATSLDLSQRTEEYSATIEETAAGMEELTSTVLQNTDRAKSANSLVKNAAQLAIEGSDTVAATIEAMNNIESGSKRIVDIIGVIDNIAFQTNILALNAAVEAARAGEQGRGFAVVASEVRNLARRSAEAAKEVKELITQSVEGVNVGIGQVKSVDQRMENIVKAVRQVASISDEITTASNEQSIGIEQMSQAIAQMEQVIQGNATLVEQIAQTAVSSQGHSSNLTQLLGKFQLNGELSAPARAQLQRLTTGASTLALPKAAHQAALTQAALSPAAPKRQPAPALAGAHDDWSTF